MSTYYSDRGLPLVYTGGLLDEPVLTVENYMKWYNLFLVLPTGEVRPLTQEEYDDIACVVLRDESSVGDHVWNPKAVILAMKGKGWRIDRSALEMITGRWYIEHVNVLDRAIRVVDEDWMEA